MKSFCIKHLILLPAIIFLFAQNSSYSQFSVGLNSGLTYCGLTGDVPLGAGYKRKIGITAGLQMEYGFSSGIAVGIGASYVKMGTIVTYDTGEKETVDSFDISFHYFSVPVLFKVFTGNKHTYFTSGIDLKKLLGADLKYILSGESDKDIKDKFEDFETAIFAGFGGKISLGQPSIDLELRYTHSLNNIGNVSSNGLPARFRFSGFVLLMVFNYATD